MAFRSRAYSALSSSVVVDVIRKDGLYVAARRE
jgi:hypothetical protein